MLLKVYDDIYHVLSRPKTCLNIKTKEHFEIIKYALTYKPLSIVVDIKTVNKFLIYNEFSCVELFTDNLNKKGLIYAPTHVYQRQGFDIIDIDLILNQKQNTKIKFKNKVRFLQWN